jgi:3-oxo-5-alpha-steroid 4-dehydrogenase 1
MNEPTFYHWFAVAWMAVAAATFVVLFFVTAPYGRFTRKGWGPRFSPRLGWILMEAPSLITFVVLFALGQRHIQPAALVFLALWMIHYVHRSFIYPFRIKSTRDGITLSVVLMAVFFNVGNGYLNGRILFSLGRDLNNAWLTDPRFIVGILLFIIGFALNQYSDQKLISLRSRGEQGYQIPTGGPYRFVSCPNYLGEIIEWGGWALACWNLGGLAFFVWTVANLAPRAFKTHQWYRTQFSDYPPERKALLPFIV